MRRETEAGGLHSANCDVKEIIEQMAKDLDMTYEDLKEKLIEQWGMIR